ncbi:MAG TPA: 16S rRNA (cytidine(1402)-2'-O)-methyltransferase [Dehalococcoidia bacterium]|nr:16S rRNA (cytidine(1402)-2'-O)-methyltransferase [Dehalococcoidia bacterium]
MPVLYLVATPIGNLEDVTLRALRVLREVSLVAAEDTRTARKLLSHYGIRARLVSYNEHNKSERIPQLLAHLRDGDVALVSEAGMPGISDPGTDLVAAAAGAGFRVVPVPGPSAVVTALAVSGLPTRRFHFLGFLPRRRGERRRLLEGVKGLECTLVALEAPHRLRDSLADVLAVLGDRPIAVCRELTKAFEEVFRGTVSAALDHFQEPRGEFTLVIGGATAPPPQADEEALRQELRALRRRGMRAREAVSQVAAQHGLPRRLVYRLWLEAAERPREGGLC